jgi:hypothetical protein
MREAAQWMEPYRRHWEQRLDRLDDYLRTLSRTTSTQKGKRRARAKR